MEKTNKKDMRRGGFYISPQDRDLLDQFNWTFDKSIGYITRRDWRTNKKYYLHQEIIKRMGYKLEKGKQVDHINQKKVDNRRENLRVTTRQGNSWNIKKYANNTSGFLGVWFDKTRKKWCAEIRIFKKKKYLGRYETPQEANAVYQIAKQTRDIVYG